MLSIRAVKKIQVSRSISFRLVSNNSNPMIDDSYKKDVNCFTFDFLELSNFLI